MKTSRRAFLTTCVTATGAWVLGIRLGADESAKETLDGSARELGGASPFDAWIRLTSDGKVELVLDRTEMGQGVYTALPMLLAEEAELDWEQVRVVQSENSVLTGGSGSVRHSYLPLRQAGAVVREAMIAAAAQVWAVPPSECRASKGSVIHPASGRVLLYGKLLDTARRLPPPDPNTVRLKQPGDFRLIGQFIPHLDIPAKVHGAARYGIDVRVPGMVFACVAQRPTTRATLVRYDATRALATPGVLQVFEIPAGETREVAVVAGTTWSAIQGRNALQLAWSPGPGRLETSDTLRAAMHRALAGEPAWSWHKGQPDPDSVAAARRIESVYEFPYLAHACMEPMNLTVHCRDDRCEAWAPTQSGAGTRQSIARVLGIPKENALVHVTFVGGAFGRRFGGEHERQAAEIGRRLQRPVKLMWTREDDFTQDQYRPACLHRLRGGLDRAGNIVAWSDAIADPYIIRDPNRRQEFETPGAVESPYPAENFRVTYAPVESVLRRGVWRSVGPSITSFAVECFIDELAHLAGEDPYRYRRRLLLSPVAKLDAGHVRPGSDSPQPDPVRLVALLDLVAEKSGWKTPLARPRGRGLSCCRVHGTYLAQVAEVSVDGDQLRVDRLITAFDCGQVVNPNGATAQVEGGVQFGLSGALKEAITVNAGRVEQDNFHTYPLLRIHEAPVLETYCVPSAQPPGGLGEAGVPLPAPSVANAVFAATGFRVKKLPIRIDGPRS
jgi:isoquinoline 1-oxidoreductase beta subunit